MTLRFNSLKTRTALAMSAVIVAILLANALYLILTKRGELRRGIEERALTFALLTRAPICTGYEAYKDSGFDKFRELMRDLLTLDRDVVRISIINVNGQVLFDTASLDDPSAQAAAEPPRRWVQEPERLEAVKRLEYTQIEGRDAAGNETLEIIVPYLEDWNRHQLSVAYQVSYRNLKPDIAQLVYATAGLTLLSMVISVLVAVGLATRITHPVEVLTAGAKDIAEGHFDRHLDIRSNDELQILAETFNHMTDRLRENIEQLEESNKKLAAVNEELKELDRMKSDLLANVSHELRTPLTAIKGYTDYILERKLGSITDKQEKGLVVVQRNLDRLSRSIDALLDFSRMDMGRIALSIQPFSLQALVEQIHTTVRSELERKRLTFVADVDPALPAVIADREKLSAVIENLVINAIKFTPEGGRITVAGSRAAGAARSAVDIRVADTGIGIPEDQIGRIFNRFHQVDGSSTRRFGGVGLGLAIVKSILEAHGSTITVESKPGKGTVFRFSLPVVEKAETRAVEDKGRDRGDAGLVLVVDGDADEVRAVRGCLEDEGLVVLAAASAASGAALAAERHPDLVLVDPMLPDRGALERSLKADPVTSRIPVMILTPRGDALRGLTRGAWENLTKPVDEQAMASAVARLLDGVAEREPTVLVVADEPDGAEPIRDTLRAEGFHTLIANQARPAIELIARKRPDLIVLDLMMRDMAGFEVLEALGRDPAAATIPVLVLTARGDAGDAQRGLALGPRRSVGKSFDVGALVAEVRRHLGGRQREGARRAVL
jgi:signal transduction histidine kinase/DNA-binding response OmpR family regulator